MANYKETAIKTNSVKLSDYGLKYPLMWIAELREYTQRNENVYFEYGDKKLYSFMTDDELYIEAFGMNKAEYQAYTQKEREREFNKRMEEEKKENIKHAQYLRENKVNEWFSKIDLYFLPEEAEQFKNYILETLDEENLGNAHVLEKEVETSLTILELAEQGKKEEAKEAYKNSSAFAEDRLFYSATELSQSIYSELFIDVLMEDVEKEYNEQESQKIREKFENRTQDINRRKMIRDIDKTAQELERANQ